MKRNNTTEFNKKLYNAVNQASKDVAVPSFDILAEGIAKDNSAESFEEFFGDNVHTVRTGKSRRIFTQVLGTVAAAVVLVMSGVLVSRMMNPISFETDSSGSVYYEESSAQRVCSLTDTADNGYIADDRKKSDEMLKEYDQSVITEPYAADLCSYEFMQAVISGGRRLLIPLDELTAAIHNDDGA